MATKKIAEKPKSRYVPVKDLITVQMEKMKVGPASMVGPLEYKSPNLISMLKSGATRLPLHKASPMARLLSLDLLFLSQCISAESGMNLEELFDQIAKRVAVTLNEEKLVRKLRTLSHGLDLDLDEHPQELATIIEAFTRASNKNAEDFAGVLTDMKAKPRSAVGSMDRKEAAELAAEAQKAA